MSPEYARLIQHVAETLAEMEGISYHSLDAGRKIEYYQRAESIYWESVQDGTQRSTRQEDVN